MVDAATAPSEHVGHEPTEADRRKIQKIIRMRTKHRQTVTEKSASTFRRRRVASSGMPQLVPACSKYSGMHWLPRELVVPDQLPKDCLLPKTYLLPYYGTSKLNWRLYHRNQIDPTLLWRPNLEWNDAFDTNDDGWAHPTSDSSFARLRLQGPNPWMLRRIADGQGPDGTAEPAFEVDYSQLYAGVVDDAVVCRFAVRDGAFIATGIGIGSAEHTPGGPHWDQAKRIANALDVRYVAFVRHLLHCHLLVGEAFALAAYSLPTWHRLRPFMQFFTYSTLHVNHTAYQALLAPSSYFIMAGFVSQADARQMYENAIASFDFEQWMVPRDLDRRGLAAIPDHPYVDDATLVWPAFEAVVQRNLDQLRYDDATIAADKDLQTWYLTLAKILPNTDVTKPLDRQRLEDLLTALIYNNVVHEICGDLSPILGSDDPADKAIVNLANLKEALAAGGAAAPVPPPSAADVFLMDQASYVSRFNVAGNKMMTINAAKFIDDPKLRVTVEDLQSTLRDLEEELEARNRSRPVTFARMLPRNWEASISF